MKNTEGGVGVVVHVHVSAQCDLGSINRQVVSRVGTMIVSDCSLQYLVLRVHRHIQDRNWDDVTAR